MLVNDDEDTSGTSNDDTDNDSEPTLKSQSHKRVGAITPVDWVAAKRVT